MEAIESFENARIGSGDCAVIDREGLHAAASAEEKSFVFRSILQHQTDFEGDEDVNHNSAMANAACLQLPIRHTTTPIVTTSSLLAIRYKDGILMCADTLASYGRMKRYKDACRYLRGGVRHDILIGSSGDYSDFQTLERIVRQRTEEDRLHDDGSMMTAAGFASWLSRVFYFRRNKFNPYWQSICVAGKNPPNSVSFYHPNQKTQPFYLGYVDLWGTFFQESVVATGLGRYFALTLMREKQRDDMTEAEARQVLEEGMRILFARDCYSSSKIQFAKVTEEGVRIDEPYQIDTNWDFEHFKKKTIDMDHAGCAW